MGNYSLEYKKYYEGLKGKSNTRTYNPNFDDYLSQSSTYGTYRNKNNKRNKNNIVGTIANIITLQLVGTIILFLMVFGAKYSSDVKLEGYYKSFKATINEDYSLEQFQEDIKAVNGDDVVQWFKEKVETNPFN